jgi:quercetin dioxygenase-like cupin family protein
MPHSDHRHQSISIDDIAPLALMHGVHARPAHGEHITLAVVEIDPGVGMPEHHHPSEQVGVVIRGEFTFTIGGETALRRPGDMWVIPAGVPHTVDAAGSDGCTVLESFSPPRADWADIAREHPSRGRWPA